MQLDPVLEEIVRKYAVEEPWYAIVCPAANIGTYWMRKNRIPRTHCALVFNEYRIMGLAPPWEIVILGWPGKADYLHAEVCMLEQLGVTVHWDGQLVH